MFHPSTSAPRIGFPCRAPFSDRGERHTRKAPGKHVAPGQNDSAWGRWVGRVGLEPISVTPLTCDDTETADITVRFHPAASPSIPLGWGSVRRSPHRFLSTSNKHRTREVGGRPRLQPHPITAAWQWAPTPWARLGLGWGAVTLRRERQTARRPALRPLVTSGINTGRPQQHQGRSCVGSNERGCGVLGHFAPSTPVLWRAREHRRVSRRNANRADRQMTAASPIQRGEAPDWYSRMARRRSVAPARTPTAEISTPSMFFTGTSSAILQLSGAPFLQKGGCSSGVVRGFSS